MGFSIRKDTHANNKCTSEITSKLCVCCKQGYRSKAKHIFQKYRTNTRTMYHGGLFIKQKGRRIIGSLIVLFSLITIRF